MGRVKKQRGGAASRLLGHSKSAASSPQGVPKRSGGSGARANKKAQRITKRTTFVQKMSDTQEADAEAKRKRAKDKTVVVGNLGLFEEALMSTLAKSSSSKTKADPVTRAQRRTTRRKGRNVTLFQESKRFTQIMKHPQFKSNPAAAITQHLKNSMSALQQPTEE